MSTQTWKDVWNARRIDPSRQSTLARLLAADGMDTGFGSVDEEPWRDYVKGAAAEIGIESRSSVFEVGCGAGAWLYELACMGCDVAGLDASPALIGYARECLPQGNWSIGDAAALEPVPTYDFVVSSGVFLYFPSLDYASHVLERMVRKAKQGVMILDVPDLALRDKALAARRNKMDEETYRRRYEGLDHLYFERAWFQSALEGLGAGRIEIRNQFIEGYGNSPYRFNVFAWLR